MKTGGIVFAPQTGCNLPEDVASAFYATVGCLVGASYVPAMYVGSQIVNGTNHFLIAERTITNAAGSKDLVEVVINIPAGSVGGKGATIVKIAEIQL